MFVRDGGSWKDAIPWIKGGFQFNETGHYRGWRQCNEWIKADGLWKAMVPVNLVQFSLKDYVGPGRICDGSLGTPDLISRYMAVARAEYVKGQGVTPQRAPIFGGANISHSGDSHGSYAPTTSAYTTITGGAGIGFTDGAASSSQTHSHVITNHSHPDWSYAELDRLEVVPFLGDPIIRKDTLVFSQTTLDSPYLTRLNVDANSKYSGKYLKCVASGGGWCSDTYFNGTRFVGRNGHVSWCDHNHGGGLSAWYTDSYTLGSVNQKQISSGNWPYQHYHNAMHWNGPTTHIYNSIRYVNTGPRSQQFNFYSVNGDMYFHDLPAGVVMAFLGSPTLHHWGSIRTDDSDPGNPCLVRSAVPGHYLPEKDSHCHAGYGFSTGNSINTWSKRWQLSSHNISEYIVSDHVHTFDDFHDTEVSSVPPYAQLFFHRKL